MSSRCLSFALVVVMAAASAAAAPLRICADPDNLPFSNRAGQGFDNRIATVVARAAGRKAVFVWARSRRGFLREQFSKGACDVLMGVPEGMKRVLTIQPLTCDTMPNAATWITSSRSWTRNLGWAKER